MDQTEDHARELNER